MTTFLSREIPGPIKQVAKYYLGLIPPRYRISSHYRQMHKFLQTAQWWSNDTIEAWQFLRLKQIVEYAYNNVPGYYWLYKEAGIKPSDIQELDHIKFLPCITKEMLRDNLRDFTYRRIPKRKRFYATTGGSTGIPFGFFQTKLNRYQEDAFIHVGWHRAGWQLGDVSAVLTGAFVGTEGKFWRYDTYERSLLLSSYYLTEDNYDRYLRKLLEYRPRHLRAYPSVATILADLMLTQGHRGKIAFKIILLGSENLYEWQKEKIASAFPTARLFAWYGHAEQVILAAMCENSDQYHVWPFYGLTEICANTGEEVQPGNVGELVGTSFWNYATPFIRYRTRDFAKKGASNCAVCGRQFQLLERIEGRLQEIILTQKGRYISMTAINMHSDLFDNVKQFQFHQIAAGYLTLRIVRKPDYTDADTRRIHLELIKKLGPDMDLQFVFVNTIAKLTNGKFRFLKQELELKYGE